MSIHLDTKQTPTTPSTSPPESPRPQCQVDSAAQQVFKTPPTVEAQLNSFLATKPKPWKTTTHKLVYQAQLNGQAVVICTDKRIPCMVSPTCTLQCSIQTVECEIWSG